MTESSEFYGGIWPGFAKAEVDEAFWLLAQRWILNKLPLSAIRDKKVLDVGCGSGRYSQALLKMGAEKVVGLDLHDPKLECEGFEFKKGSALKLPFSDGEFDFVFCNGVLHHTRDWRQGIKEAYRVLKEDGCLWLLMCGESKWWDYNDRIRAKMDAEDAKAFRDYLIARGWPRNKIFFLLDAFFTPFRVYNSKIDIMDELADAGFERIHFMDCDIEDSEPAREMNLRFFAWKDAEGNLG